MGAVLVAVLASRLPLVGLRPLVLPRPQVCVIIEAVTKLILSVSIQPFSELYNLPFSVLVSQLGVVHTHFVLPSRRPGEGRGWGGTQGVCLWSCMP